MAAKSNAEQEKAASFESAIQRLEVIVEQMESDKLPLEELLARYEEGMSLVRVCSEKLAAAEKRIEMISRAASGDASVTAFEPARAAGKKAGATGEEATLF